jgi:transketolase
VACEKAPVPVFRVGVKDEFGKSGTNAEMKAKFGLRAADIKAAALMLMDT